MYKRIENILILILLLAVNFIAHSMQFQNMGLYEDDYEFLAKAVNWDQVAYSEYLSDTWLKIWPQGRPLGFSIPQTIAYIFKGDNTLSALYLFGALILTINAFLCFTIFKAFLKDFKAALFGAILFSLFPADTTKPYLLHIFHIQTSLMFCLVALYIYIKHQKFRFISYFLGICCLITYETPFSLFLLFPLFSVESKGKKLWIKHCLIIATSLALIVLIRILMGDDRVTLLGHWSTIIAQIMASMVFGPVVSMGLFLYAPARTVLHMNNELWIVMLTIFPVVLGLLIWVIYQYPDKIVKADSNKVREFTLLAVTIRIQDWTWQWMKMTLFAVLWLMTAYILSFSHYPPVVRYGRGTSVHISATIPASLLCVLLLWGIWRMLAHKKLFRNISLVLLAGYISVVIGNRYSIQQDFVKSWNFQKQYWNDVIELIPDVDDGTIVFVVNHHLPEEHYILSNTWTDFIILGELIDFPENWSREPIVISTDGNWEKNMQLVEGKTIYRGNRSRDPLLFTIDGRKEKNLQLPAGTIIYPWSLYWIFEIDSSNVILLTDDINGNLIRVNDIEINTLSGISFATWKGKMSERLIDQYPTTRLFEIMNN
ncbi:MAG: hypothetical protein JEZ00_20400 [Anaerolineaceae bacterium]|nr:hypothetical protein [Anaerolineaceae bacterium]